MIDKLTIIKKLFNKQILKKHNVSKNKSKTFIIFSSNNKLNWIMFRNIITRAHHQFQLNPILFLTDSLGEFEDALDPKVELNPLLPLFNIIKFEKIDINKEQFVHNDILGIKYATYWNQLGIIGKTSANLLLFTDNLLELQKLIQTVKNKDREIVIFYLQNKKEKPISHSVESELLKYESWIIKYSPKVLKKWEKNGIYDVLVENLNFRKEKKLRRIRNNMFIIMNQYYKYGITPSYINDEPIYNKNEMDELEKIKIIYDTKKRS